MCIIPDAPFLNSCFVFVFFSTPFLILCLYSSTQWPWKTALVQTHSEVSNKQVRDNLSESRLTECETIEFQRRHAAKVPARVGHVHSSLLSVLRLVYSSHTETQPQTDSALRQLGWRYLTERRDNYRISQSRTGMSQKLHLIWLKLNNPWTDFM